MFFILCSHLHVSSVLEVAAVGIKDPLDLTRSLLEHGRLVVDVAESWFFRRLPQQPVTLTPVTRNTDSFDVCVPVAPEL